MVGYKNGKVEIWYGDNPPSNLNILWMKRIMNDGLETSELTQYNRDLGVWESLKNSNISNNLSGTNYIMVYGIGTPAENAIELQAAYDTAKTMPRYIGTIQSNSGDLVTIYKGQTFYDSAAFTYGIVYQDYIGVPAYEIVYSDINDASVAKSVRTTVVVAPGDYRGATTFVHYSSGINVVSLTGNMDVQLDCLIYAENSLVKGIKGVSINNNLPNSVIEDCEGAFYPEEDNTSTYRRCIGGANSFGSDNSFEAILENCKLTVGNYPTPTGSGKIYNCIDGNGDLINYPSVGVLPYKVYSGIFTQTGTGIPTVTVLENTIGNIVWTRNSIGNYIGTLNGAFIQNKTISPQDSTRNFSMSDAIYILGVRRFSDNAIEIVTFDDTIAPVENDILYSKFIEIRVYN